MNEGSDWDGDRSRTFQRRRADSPATIAAINQIMMTHNDPPKIFTLEGTTVTLRRTAESGLVPETVTADRMVNLLAKATSWVDGAEGQERPILPPLMTARLYLAAEDKPFPPLHSIVAHPVVSREGEIVTAPGYHKESGAFVHAPDGLEFYPVADEPPHEEVIEAINLLHQPLADINLAEDESRANYLALLITPGLRQFIDGPIPAFCLNKRRAGEQATLCSELPARIWTGQEPTLFSNVPSGTDGEKLLLAAFRQMPEFILFDNVRERIDSGPLASCITSRRISGRVLRSSNVISIPTNAVLIINGINIQTSNEVARRLVPIFLDSGRENPADYVPEGGFRFPDLKRHAIENRHQYIWAALTLYRHWRRHGSPRFTGVPFGSFENWAAILGGILECAGVSGFLGNLQRLRSSVDQETQALVDMASAWWGAYGDRNVSASAVLELADAHGIPLPIRGAGERSRRILMGNLLRERVDSTFGGLTIRSARTRGGNANNYFLENPGPTESEPAAEA